MTSDDNSQLLAIGKQCSHPSCLLVDFLPFKCQHCTDSFCQEHFKVVAHKCSKYDENKHNRIAPDCPVCQTPVAVRPGQDPNDRMDEHLEKECSGMTGKSGKARTMPVCAKGNCKKVLFSPIASPSPPSAKNGVSNLGSGVNTKALNMKASAAGAATLDAIKKATTPAFKPTSVPTTEPGPSKPPISSHVNPFSKTDRHFSSLHATLVTPTDDSTTCITPTTTPNETYLHNDNTTTPTKNISTPKPFVDYNAFVPPPIFAWA
ncbi:hypothetical protein H0H81_008898 [Sphagnurus paluster]|uniref:AN1-type domain-containing protein n=1 Tax=Sphagnurus paluster TaxID=117069 RepID=A0A9P7FWN9_9AGAR|nr:hypothetical protein H0H81_008898 [Sphagnurus paluster]